MKTRNLFIIAVIAALAAGGFWYFRPPAPGQPVKTAETPKAAPAQPAPAVAPPVAATPKAPPAPKPESKSAKVPAATTANANAAEIAELNDTINDMSTLLKSGDFEAYFDKYTRPDMLASITPANHQPFNGAWLDDSEPQGPPK